MGGGATPAAARRAVSAAGATLAVHRAFEHGEPSRSHLRGWFRSLPCDGASLYIGEASAIPQADPPTCFLAPSIDGGRSRRLLSLQPLRAGALLTVPLGFDAARWQPRMDAALAAAEDANAQDAHTDAHADVVAEAGGGRGRGVFAGRAYAEGELVASWACRAVADADVPVGLKDYLYTAPGLGTGLVVLGHGMLYNQGVPPNIGWSVPSATAELLLSGEGRVRFFARRAIVCGEELLSSYGEGYWSAKGVTPW